MENLSFIPITKAAKANNWHKTHLSPSLLSGTLSKDKREGERQIHIEGIATKVSPEESDEYFRKRPYKSRIGARISPQSQPIASRMQLIRSFVREAARWIGKEVERPDNWGGYAVTPTRIEFWQGRPNRLHDRFLYTLQPDGEWKISRLAP